MGYAEGRRNLRVCTITHLDMMSLHQVVADVANGSSCRAVTEGIRNLIIAAITRFSVDGR